MTTDERAAKRAGAQKFWAAHRATWEASGGTEMTEVLGMDVVQLNTVGRKSGELRWVLLTTLPADAGGWLVVASNLGADSDPNWWTNLQAAGGKGSVTVKGTTTPVTATALAGAERDAAYQRFVDTYPGYVEYRQATTREIPVVHLEP